MNCSTWSQQTQFLSTTGSGNKMKIKSRLLTFFSCVFSVNMLFVFSFIVFSCIFSVNAHFFLKFYSLLHWSKFWLWLSVKRCTNGESDFWLSIKSISNTLSCCCFVCVFIIGQHHSGNNRSKSGAGGEILFFENEKCHEIRPWKRTHSLWMFLMLSFTYMTNQNITSVIDLHRWDIAYKIE